MMYKYSKISLFFIFLLVATIPGYSQKKGRGRIDSVLKVISVAQDDTNKVKMLEDVCLTFRKINADTGLNYGQQALELAQKLNWEKGIAQSYTRLGLNYKAKGDFNKALGCYFNSLKICEKLDMTKDMANNLYSIGVIYMGQAEYAKALEYYKEAFDMNKEIGDKGGIEIVNMNIGLVYVNESNYPKALTYLLQSLKLAEELGNKSELARGYLNIGEVYFYEVDYSSALNYYFKAIKIYTELNDKYGLANTLSSIGNVYLHKADFIKARDNYNQSMEKYKELDHERGNATKTSNIGKVYLAENDFGNAIGYLYKSLKISKILGEKMAIGTTYTDISKVYQKMASDSNGKKLHSISNSEKMKLLEKARKYADSSIAVLNGIGDLHNLQEAYLTQSHNALLLGDYKSSLGYYSQYVKVKDSAFGMDKDKKITQLSMQYDFDKKQDSTQARQIEKDAVHTAVVKKQRIIIYSVAIGLILFILLSLSIFRNLNENKKKTLVISKEKKRSEELLLNILPAGVAEELKEKGSAKAKHFDNVTVMFTDFKGFTTIGEKLTPTELVAEINHCFIAYDNIIHKHGIEKIKTIGDAYLAVCGLPEPDSNHAVKVVEACMDIVKFMEAYKTDRIKNNLPYFEARVGINSGSVVAGIVGVKKFAYDIWGDTVNTAARMEQSSEAGKINISGTTYELVKETFNCIYRGKIQAKNKGEIDMYFVVG